jgi:cytochrome c oxidase subunit 2
VQKGWSVLFAVILIASFLIWFAAPFYGWWLPDNISSFGPGVDNLFYIILGFVAFFFVLTEVVLVYGMWKFTGHNEKTVYTHGNHRLEILWTAVPAAILLFIAFAQIGVWEKIKYQSRMPPPKLTVSVLARQWEWRLRYPLDNGRFSYDADDKKAAAEAHRKGRAWAENSFIDDVHATNELHAWKNADVKVWLRTLDVLHSFTLPNLRLKQDTLPGKTIPMWFRAEKANCRFVLRDRTSNRPVILVFDEASKDLKVKDREGEDVVPIADRLPTLRGEIVESGNKKDAWEIACQELCGGRHYAMRGRLYVHEDESSYYAWLHYSRHQQKARTLDAVALAN